MIQFLDPVAQAKPNFLTDFPDAHAFGDQQFAGQGGPLLSPFTHVVGHATVLAIFVPAKAAVGNWLGGEVLETPQQRIVLGNLHFSAEKFDGDQARVGAEEGGRRGHWLTGMDPTRGLPPYSN